RSTTTPSRCSGYGWSPGCSTRTCRSRITPASGSIATRPGWPGWSPIFEMSLRFVPAIPRATHRIGLSLASLPAPGLTPGEAHILAHLAVDGPATVGELHAGLSHKRSTLTSILDRLTARGLITRTPSPRDRRSFIVAPTPKGKALAARVRQHFDAIE